MYGVLGAANVLQKTYENLGQFPRSSIGRLMTTPEYMSSQQQAAIISQLGKDTIDEPPVKA